MRKLRSGVACSILFLLASQQVGSTYAGFTDQAELENSITFCAVFPDTVKQRLLAFRDHVLKAAALQASLKGFTPSAGSSGLKGIESMSLEELDAAEQELSGRITSLQAEISSADSQLIANNQIWSDIAAELNAASAALAALGGDMQKLDSGCLDLGDPHFFNELQSSISQSGVLSESLSESIEGIIRYLRSVQNQGNLFTTGVADIVYGGPEFSQPEPLQTLPFLITLQDGNISGGLTAMYDSYTAELTQAKDHAAAGISTLESQRALIGEIRARRLEEIRLAELEKARLAEEEKLAEEQQQEEAGGGEKAEENETAPEAAPEVPPEAVPSPEPIEEASPAETPAPETPPAAAEQQDDPEETAVPEPSDAPIPSPGPSAGQ
ncbi:hypothetical protein [Paenibacillus tengchongensis]|uniref:hypothetical protein n=1 Tax=Paenibacillus tengchongensis TaxID=2608684 RepID=UPI00124D5AB0|nr:hypothetical protein [Paenibacillus tengchongensis]